jgi:hypothetical protein
MGVWTRNYDNIITAFYGHGIQTAQDENGTASYTENNLTIKNVSGIFKKILTKSIDYLTTSFLLKTNGIFYNGSGTLALTQLGIGCGTGLTAENYEDYKLETSITAGLALVSADPARTQYYDTVTHKYSWKRIFSLQNTTLSNITVSEVGLFINVTATAHGGGYVPSLIYRDCFEAVILEPNDILLIEVQEGMIIPNYTPYP